jgi:two-component sensor histidine kinase
MWSEGERLAGKMYGDSPSSMAQRVAAFDWASTPLGPSADWPPELKTVVRQILESSFPSAVIWGPDFTTIYNDAFRPILGNKPEALGRSFADIWSEVWESIGPIARKAYAGDATYIENYPLTIERSGRPERAWFTFCYSPLRLSDGTVAGMIDTVVETTSTILGREQLDLLNNELGHRLKNTLALVQAIAAQSLKTVSESDAVEAFRDRITALSNAHDVLLSQNWATASLDAIVRQTLAPLDGLQQVQVSGEDLQLGSQPALSLSLILHELATNAAKYGALSVPDGRVTLAWEVADGAFQMHWREMGGPTVEEPSKTGFGSRLIRRGLSSAGTVDLRYAPSGLEMDLVASECGLFVR